MDTKISLRSLLLAGVGTVALSMEKSMEIVDQLVKKGELTVSQGKELNQELRNRFQEKMGKPELATKAELQQLEDRVRKLEEQLP